MAMKIHTHNAMIALCYVITMVHTHSIDSDEIQSFGIYVTSSSNDPFTLRLCYSQKLYECENITPHTNGQWFDCELCSANDWLTDGFNYEICAQYQYDTLFVNNTHSTNRGGDNLIISQLRHTTIQNGETIFNDFCVPSNVAAVGGSPISGAVCESFGIYVADDVYDTVEINTQYPQLLFYLDASTQTALVFEDYFEDPDDEETLFQINTFSVNVVQSGDPGADSYALSACFMGNQYQCVMVPSPVPFVFDCNSFQWAVTINSAVCGANSIQNEQYGTLFFIFTNMDNNDVDGIVVDETITTDFTNGTRKVIDYFCINEDSGIASSDYQGVLVGEDVSFGSYGYYGLSGRTQIEIVPNENVLLYFGIFDENTPRNAFTTYSPPLDIDVSSAFNKHIRSFISNPQTAALSTYESAQRECVKKGGRLATTTSPFQRNMVSTMCDDISTDDCWFGTEYTSPPKAFGFRGLSTEATSSNAFEYTLCYQGISYECAEPWDFVGDPEYLCTIDTATTLSIVYNDINCVNSKYYFMNIVNMDMDSGSEEPMAIDSVFIIDANDNEYSVNGFMSTQSMDALNDNTNYNAFKQTPDDTSWSKFSGLGSAFDILYYSVGSMVVYLDYNIAKGLVNDDYIDPTLFDAAYYATLLDVDDDTTTTETDATSANSDAFACEFSNVYEFGIWTAILGHASSANEYALSLCYYGFKYQCTVKPEVIGAYYVCNEDNWSMSSNDADCALNSDKMSVTISNVNPIEDSTDILIISAIQVSTTLSTVIKNEFCVDARDASISMALIQNSDMKACSLTNDYGLYSIPYNYVYDEIKLDPTMNTQCTIYFDNVDTNNALVTDHYIDDNSFTNHLNFISFETNRRTSLYPDSLCTNKGGALAASQSTAYGNYIVNDVLCSDPHSEYCISCQFSKIESFSIATSDASPPSSIPLMGLCFYGMRYLCNDVQISGDEYTCDEAGWSIELEVSSAYMHCNWQSKYLHLFVSPDAFDISEINVQFMDGTAIQKRDICRVYTPDDIDMISFTDGATYSDSDCVAPLQSSSDFIFTGDTISSRAMSVDSASAASVLDSSKIPVSFGLAAYNSFLTFRMRLCYDGHSYECVASSLNDPTPPLCTIDSWDASLDSSVNQCTDSYNWILLECTEPSGCGSTLRIGHENNINVQINFNDGTTIYSETFCRDSGDTFSQLGACSTWTIGTETNQYYGVEDITDGNALVYVDEDIDDAFFISVTTSGYDMKQIKSFGFYILNIINIELGYALCHDGIRYACSNINAELSVDDAYVMCDINEWSVDKDESSNGCTYQAVSEDYLHLTVSPNTAAFVIEYALFEYNGDRNKKVSSFCVDRDIGHDTEDGYIKLFTNQYPSCDRLAINEACEHYTKSEMENYCNSNINCIGFVYNDACAPNCDACFQENYFCSSTDRTVHSGYDYYAKPEEHCINIFDGFDYDTLVASNATYNVSNRRCSEWLSTVDQNEWNSFPVTPFNSDLVFYLNVDADELLVTHDLSKAFEGVSQFGFTTGDQGSSDAYLVRLCEYDTSLSSFVSYECTITPLEWATQYLCTRDSWQMNINNNQCDGYKEYSTILVQSVVDTAIQMMNIDQVAIYYYDGRVTTRGAFCVDDIAEGANPISEQCAWYYGARNSVYDYISFAPNHESIFYIDEARTMHALVSFNYLTVDDLMEPVQFGMYRYCDWLFLMDLTVSLCWKGARFQCPHMRYEGSWWSVRCGTGTEAVPWTLALDDADCLKDVHHSSVRVEVHNAYDEDNCFIDEMWLTMSDNEYDVDIKGFCIQDGGVIDESKCPLMLRGSQDCYQWKAAHDFSSGDAKRYDCVQTNALINPETWAINTETFVMYISDHYSADNDTSALVTLDYISSDALRQPIQFGFKASSDTSTDGFSVHLCYENIPFECAGAVIPDTADAWYYCDILEYQVTDSQDQVSVHCHALRYDFLYLEYDGPSTGNADSLGINAISVLFNDGTSMEKDTFCIKTAEHHEGVVTNGDSCLSLGFGNVYENIIIDATESTYLYWEHADDTQPVYVTAESEPNAELINTFADIAVVHTSNGNYAKLVASVHWIATTGGKSGNYLQADKPPECTADGAINSIASDPTQGNYIGVVCCNNEGVGDRTGCIGQDAGATYREAVDHCVAMGKRLCTLSEVVHGFAGRGTGCSFDGYDVWTSDQCFDASQFPTSLSWEEANQYCQAYGYLGLATVLSAELNTEAASLCGSGECWIGAYLLHGLCDAEHTDMIKCWKWIASYNAAFVYSNFDDSDNDDLDNFNSHQFVYTYLDTADANEWRTVDDKTVERAYGVLCDVTLKSTHINDQWSSVTCNNDASKALFAGLFNINEDVMTHLDDTIMALTARERLQQHIICTETVFLVLNTLNPLSWIIKGFSLFVLNINLILDGVQLLADVLDIPGIGNAVTDIIRTINNGFEDAVQGIANKEMEFGEDDIVDLTEYYFDLLKFLTDKLCDELVGVAIADKLEQVKDALFNEQGTGVLDELTVAIEQSLGIESGTSPASQFEHVVMVGDEYLDFTVAINIGMIMCYDKLKWSICMKNTYNVAVNLRQEFKIYEARALYFEGPDLDANSIDLNLGFSLPVSAFVEYDFLPRLDIITESPNFFELGIAVNWDATYLDDIMNTVLPIINLHDLQFKFLPPFLNQAIGGEDATWTVGLIGDFSQNLLAIHCGGFRLSTKAASSPFAVHISANFRGKLDSIDYGMEWTDDIHLGEFRGISNRLLDVFDLIGDQLIGPMESLKDKMEEFGTKVGEDLKDGAMDAVNEMIDALNTAICGVVDGINIIFKGINKAEDKVRDKKGDCKDRLRSVGLKSVCSVLFDPVMLVMPNVEEIECEPVIDNIRRRNMMGHDAREHGTLDLHLIHKLKAIKKHLERMKATINKPAPAPTAMAMDDDDDDDDDDVDEVMYDDDDEDNGTHAVTDATKYSDGLDLEDGTSASASDEDLILILFFGLLIGVSGGLVVGVANGIFNLKEKAPYASNTPTLKSV